MNNAENLPTDNNNKSIVKGHTMYTGKHMMTRIKLFRQYQRNQQKKGTYD